MKRFISLLLCLTILCGCSSFNNKEDDIQITSGEQLKGKTIGIVTGSVYENFIKEHFSNSKFSYFNTRPELILALKSKKISAFMLDDFTAIQYMKQNNFMTPLNEDTMSIDNGFIFSNYSENVLDEFNAYLKICKSNGYLSYLKDKWVNNMTDDTRITPISFTGEKGILNAITATDSIPMSFMSNGEYQGYETELFYNFCAYAGYTPNIQGADFGAIITAISTGKYDLAFAGITMTEERKKNVKFSEPVYSASSIIIVLDQSAELSDDGIDPTISSNSSYGFLDTIKHKFNQMFVEEDRWLLILNGIKVTVLITVLSLLIGTVFGFIIYLISSKTGSLLKRIFNKASFIINRIPVLIILMFMFYIVFSNSSIDGVYISIIAFSVIETFSVYSMLNTGIDAIDKGQTEAGLALGYTNNQTLFKFVLPQALKIIMPSYKNDVVSLLKSTSVVGYITVQDLTRVSDIIRSRTYEAFFPLLASAIIYFVLAWLLSFIVEKIQKAILPSEKTKEEILDQYK